MEYEQITNLTTQESIYRVGGSIVSQEVFWIMVDGEIKSVTGLIAAYEKALEAVNRQLKENRTAQYSFKSHKENPKSYKAVKAAAWDLEGQVLNLKRLIQELENRRVRLHKFVPF